MKWSTGYQWCEVRVVNGGLVARNEVLGNVEQLLTNTIPLGYKEDGRDSVFYIDDVNEGQFLERYSWKGSVRAGARACELSLKVMPCNPRVNVTEDLRESIRASLRKRYNSISKHLNLSQFHRDPDLSKKGVCSVTNPAIMKVVLKFIIDNIPDITSIDLSSNKIMYLDQFQTLGRDLAENVKYLRAVNLNNNLIPDVRQLRNLQCFPIEVLSLTNNPVFAELTSSEGMTKRLGKFLPKLKKIATQITPLDSSAEKVLSKQKSEQKICKGITWKPKAPDPPSISENHTQVGSSDKWKPVSEAPRPPSISEDPNLVQECLSDKWKPISEAPSPPRISENPSIIVEQGTSQNWRSIPKVPDPPSISGNSSKMVKDRPSNESRQTDGPHVSEDSIKEVSKNVLDILKILRDKTEEPQDIMKKHSLNPKSVYLTHQSEDQHVPPNVVEPHRSVQLSNSPNMCKIGQNETFPNNPILSEMGKVSNTPGICRTRSITQEPSIPTSSTNVHRSQSVRLPLAQCTFLCTDDGKDFVEKFVQHYYTMYDGEDRRSLFDTYHENALFSLSFNQPVKNRFHNMSHTAYVMENRNLLHTSKHDIERTLHVGNYEIVKCLSRLPVTEHDPASFSVDLPILSKKLVLLHISGVFREFNTPKDIKSFQRTFVLTSNSDNVFKIVNEELFISATTSEQKKVAFREENVKPTASPSKEHDKEYKNFVEDALEEIFTSVKSKLVGRLTPNEASNMNTANEASNMNTATEKRRCEETETKTSKMKPFKLENTHIRSPFVDWESVTFKDSKVSPTQNKRLKFSQSHAQSLPARQTKVGGEQCTKTRESAADHSPKTRISGSMKSDTVDKKVDNDTKHMLVDVFSKTTSMKLNWSKKCLQDNNWDMKRALDIFSDLCKHGAIPKDAFQQ